MEKTEAKDKLHYFLYLSAVDSFSSHYFNDEYIVWTGEDGPIADFINEVIDTHKDYERKDPGTTVIDSVQAIYPIVPYKDTISNDLRLLTERAYIKIDEEKATSRYLPVLINKETNTLYIPFQLFSNHNDALLLLH